MERTLDITDERLEYIMRKLAIPAGEGLSAEELAERLNVSRSTVLRLLKRLIVQGQVTFAGYEVYTRIDGQKMKRPVYKAVEK